MMNNYSSQDFLSVARRITYDATIPELLEEAVRNHEGRLSDKGAICVTTGKHTGRSPKDKYIVMDENSKDTVWWTSDEYKNVHLKIDLLLILQIFMI